MVRYSFFNILNLFLGASLFALVGLFCGLMIVWGLDSRDGAFLFFVIFGCVIGILSSISLIYYSIKFNPKEKQKYKIVFSHPEDAYLAMRPEHCADAKKK